MSLGKDPLSSTPVFIGKSRIAQDIREFIAIASRSDAAVLLTGKTGVGKELVAKAIHYQSPRITRPFLVINPSGVPESLMESCLFGHEKGAFTGATELMRGPFEMASGKPIEAIVSVALGRPLSYTERGFFFEGGAMKRPYVIVSARGGK